MDMRRAAVVPPRIDAVEKNQAVGEHGLCAAEKGAAPRAGSARLYKARIMTLCVAMPDINRCTGVGVSRFIQHGKGDVEWDSRQTLGNVSSDEIELQVVRALSRMCRQFS